MFNRIIRTNFVSLSGSARWEQSSLKGNRVSRPCSSASKNRYLQSRNVCNKNEANNCKCPNSEKIDLIQQMVTPTFLLTCGMSGYIIGDMIFTGISIFSNK